jgi:flagellar protein FliT
MKQDLPLEERVSLKCYNHMVHLSQLMLAAAQLADWEQVSKLEIQCQRVVDELKELPANDSSNLWFKQEKMRLIRSVLAIDAQIRDLAQPRIRQLELAMRAPHTARRLASTYGCTNC